MSKFIQEENGATMLEYGLLITLIALVAAAGVAIFGLAVASLFDDAVEKAQEVQ